MDDKASAKKLCSYIHYFENVDPNEACRWITPAGEIRLAGNFEYDKEISSFARDVHDSGLMCNYVEILKKRNVDMTNITLDMIESSDLELTKAILTRIVRNERFCDGAWKTAVEGGYFLAILRRLEFLLLSDN